MNEIFWTTVVNKLRTMPEEQWDTVLKDFDSKTKAAILAEMQRLARLAPSEKG